MILGFEDGSVLLKLLISRLSACIGAAIFNTEGSAGHPKCT